MSVHRSKRKIAFSEFERQAVTLKKHTHERISHVPNRYKKFICPDLYELTGSICRDVIYANEQTASDPQRYALRVQLLHNALDTIQSLQAPLWCFWNLLSYKPSSMQCWVDMLNRESALIIGVLREERKFNMIKVLPYEQIQKAAFLKKLSELQRYTYGKIAHEPLYLKDYLLDDIKRSVDNAFTSALFGNAKIPETKAEYINRTKHLRHSLDSLNHLQRPLYALWNISQPSENVMVEWSALIDGCITLVHSVIVSDRKRFSSLT